MALWIVIPSAMLYGISVFTDTKVFFPRYYLATAPAIALCVAALLTRIPSPETRRLMGAVISLCAFVVLGLGENFLRGTEDWRGAAEAIRTHSTPDTPVLTVAGAIQARAVKDIEDPKLQDVLFAPWFRYGVYGQHVRLPLQIEPEVEAYLERQLPTLLRRPTVLLVGMSSTLQYQSWLSARLGPLGYKHRVLGYYGGIVLIAFERSSSL
jgi:hypothetical protein